jgi:putative SOS response-associated peptidase YedK
MPVILPPAAYAPWLDPQATPEELTELLCPAATDVLVARPISHNVNSPANDDAECVGPAE